MEGIGYLQRWNKNLPGGILLLLMSVTVGAFTLQDSQEKSCPPGDFITEEGICCNKCPAGFKLAEKCHATGQRSNCTECPPGEFTEQINFSPNCRRCRSCKEKNNEVEKTKCERYQNTVCQCKDGYYKSIIDSQTYECLRCTKCQPDERQIEKCTENKNTVCGCEEKYHKVNGKCELCKNCTEFKDPSTTPKHSTGSGPALDPLISVIVGALTVGLVLLFLVFLITYVATKRFTKKKMKSASFQPSSTSFDSCQQILVSTDESSENISVKAIPQTAMSEQELANLPDCVPLEIKLSDLIYTVLDLVPVQRMKELVRSLGLKDTEIEQAEVDHRSCKEAHYQMLRIWAERSPRAVGRGRGGMLHRPLLEELLDKLRQIHLGWAAEELETKYGIQ